MKAKHRIWKSKLAKTTFLMTVVLVAALFLGSAASAGLKSTSSGTVTQTNNKIPLNLLGLPENALGPQNTATQTQMLSATQGTVTGLAPHSAKVATQPQQPASPLGRGYFLAFNAYDPNGMPNGPVTFDMDAVVNLIQATGPNFISGADVDADGNWYAVAYSGGLYKTDPATGDMTFIANTIPCNSLVFDTTTGIWYVATPCSGTRTGPPRTAAAASRGWGSPSGSRTRRPARADRDQPEVSRDREVDRREKGR